MPAYNPPIRDMQFVMHEVLGVVDELKALPPYADIDADTINAVVWVPERLSDAALVNAVATATEAKSQALWDKGLDATGTATDAVCIVCPDEGTMHTFGGPRSVWGARIARALHAAVLAAR